MTINKDLKYGIVDEALPQGQEDSLDVTKYTKSLVKFIKYTDTPMTIGVQGSWGSGKTSLLNQIWHELDQSNKNDSSIKNFKQIWINSWENSLLCTPEECLLKIINRITQELIEADPDTDKKDKIQASVKNVMQGALRLTGAVALGAAGKDLADGIINNEANSIESLRKELDLIVKHIKDSNKNEFFRMVIYVDDLDRMNPPEAVRLLELLKNIFNLPHCVFVLAIDYQVVVKGLKEKFGPRTEDNDFEFRSFFDKIIQLPFNMPINDYKIGQYVISLLKDIGFVEESWVDGNFEEHVNKFVSSTIGGNPRSIKRLINSLSLIKILISEDGEASNTKKGSLIMFAIVCLQVAFPKIYELLQEESRFWDWNEELARGVTQGKEEEEKDWVKNFTARTRKDKKFDDAWEQCLYRVCYLNKSNRARVSDISELLNYILEEVGNSDKEELAKLIEEALGKTSVTSITTKEDLTRKPRGHVIASGFDDWKKINESSKTNLQSKDQMQGLQDIVNYYKKEYGAVNQDSSEESEFKIKYAATSIALEYTKSKAKASQIIRFHPVSKKDGRLRMSVRKFASSSFDNTLVKINDIEFNHNQDWLGFNDDMTDVMFKRFSYVEWMDALFEPRNIDYKVIDRCISEGKHTLENNLHDINRFHEKKFNDHLENIRLGKTSEGYKTSFNFIEEYFSREVIKIKIN